MYFKWPIRVSVPEMEISMYHVFVVWIVMFGGVGGDAESDS